MMVNKVVYKSMDGSFGRNITHTAGKSISREKEDKMLSLPQWKGSSVIYLPPGS
jgi:hypothetical protein